MPARHGLWLLITLFGCSPQPVCRLDAPRREVLMIAAYGHHVRWDSHEVGAVGHASGLDLDGRVDDGSSDECTAAPDLVSDWTGSPGIDNQFAARLLGLVSPGSEGRFGAPVGDAFSREIVEEQLSREIGLVGLAIDPRPHGSVEVTLLELVPAPSDGWELAAGARVRARAVETVAAELEAFESDGVLRFGLSSMRLPIGVRDGVRPIHDARLELDVDACGRVTRGELGGVVAFETLLEIFAARLERSLDDPELPGIVVDVAAPDLEPDAEGVCRGLSFGAEIALWPVIAER